MRILRERSLLLFLIHGHLPGDAAGSRRDEQLEELVGLLWVELLQAPVGSSRIWNFSFAMKCFLYYTMSTFLFSVCIPAEKKITTWLRASNVSFPLKTDRNFE